MFHYYQPQDKKFNEKFEEALLPQCKILLPIIEIHKRVLLNNSS